METKQVTIDEYTIPVRITEKPLLVKEWFAAKKFREIRHSGLFDNCIFAIFAETEKAYNCLVGGLSTMINTWVPKSLVEEDTRERNKFEREGRTFVCNGYTEAKNILDAIIDYYD